MPSDPRQIRPRHWFALTAILLLAALVRLHNVKTIPLSNDELGTMEVAAGRGVLHLTLPRNAILTPPPPDATLKDAEPIWHIPSAMRDDVHPPLYFLLLRLWQNAFGGDDARSRLLSVVAGVTAVALIFDVGRWLGSTETGLWSALLMTLAQPQIIHSQTARPYALATALILAAADAVLRIRYLGPSRRRNIALIAALTAVSLTLYFAIPAALAIFIFAMAFTTRPTRRNVAVAFFVAAFLATTLWAYGFRSQLANLTAQNSYWYKDYTPNHGNAVLQRFACLPLRFLAEPLNDQATRSVATVAAVLYVLPWLMVRRRPQLILPATWLLLCTAPIAAMDLARGTNQLFWIKYTLMAAPAVYLILPMMITSRRLGSLLPAAAALYCVISVAQAESIPTIDYARLAADVDRCVRPGDGPILFDTGMNSIPFTGRTVHGRAALRRKTPAVCRPAAPAGPTGIANPDQQPLGRRAPLLSRLLVRRNT
jgi:hypothetical protein